MDSDLERELVDRLRRGDAAAFDAIYAELNPRLLTFLTRVARRRDVAEDLLDETWLRLVRQAARLRPDTQIGAWLFTVARNLYVSYCRSRHLEAACETALIGLWPTGLAQASPFEATATSEFERRLERAIASLPARSCEVLLLVTVDGLKPAEAAAVCGISAEALRQRLSRARALLAERLDRPATPVAPTWREVWP